jgi:hypothetical protein
VLRNWLTDNGLVRLLFRFSAPLAWLGQAQTKADGRVQKGKPDVEMPPEVVEKTKARYTEVFERLTGNSLEEALSKLSA